MGIFFLINHAVNYFLSQWYSGLQPSLNINTCHNGEIFISSKVKSIGQELYRNRRRRSGRHARERRRKERSQTIASNKSIVEETVQLETVEEKKSLNSVLLACDEEINSDISIKSDAVPDVTSKEVNLIDDAVCQLEEVMPSADVYKPSESNSDLPHHSYCSKAFDDSIIDWNLSTAQRHTVHHHFPRERTFTADEFKQMLRGYGFT